MRLLRRVLAFFVILLQIATTTSQLQAVPPAGSYCADLVNVLPPQWQKNLNLTVPANANANPYWCCNPKYICCGGIYECHPTGTIDAITFMELQLNGSIPDGLGSLTSLQYLSLANNSLTGDIPESLGKLVQLTYLDLGSNQLSGTIPDVFENLTQLNTLNSLTGTIPESFGNMGNLKSLIPYALGNLAQLEILSLANNSLTGIIPQWFRKLVNLKILGLGSNKLNGSIPDLFENLIQLEILSLANNSLTGAIPESLGNLVNLIILELGSNKLNGSIPDLFENLIQLEILSLANNSLTGAIPESLGNLVNLIILELGSNKLNGSIPDLFENLIQLKIFDLTDNQLIGSIPLWIGKLINLNILGLALNQLSGSIPETLGNLTGLEVIELLGNQLSGPVPKLSNLKNLTTCFVDNLNLMFVILGIAVGSLLFIVTLSLFMQSLNRGKKMPRMNIRIYTRESWKNFWSRPSYESTEAEVLRIGVSVILLATLTGYAIFLLHQIATYTPAQSFALDTTNTVVQIPIIEIKGPSTMKVPECIYQNAGGSVSCLRRGVAGFLDDPTINIQNISSIHANPFYIANALDQFATGADTTPEPTLNVSLVQITLTTDSSPNANDFHSQAVNVSLRHIDAINTNGADLSKADAITESSVPILPGYINQVQFTTTTRQLLDEGQTLARYHLSGIPLKNSTTLSPSVALIGETGDGTTIIIIRPQDFVTQVITDKATYTLLGAIPSFLGTLTSVVTVYSWLFGVGKLRPWGVVHQFSIERRTKKLNILDIIKDVDCESPLTSSDSKPATSEELELLRRQVFFYLKLKYRQILQKRFWYSVFHSYCINTQKYSTDCHRPCPCPRSALLKTNLLALPQPRLTPPLRAPPQDTPLHVYPPSCLPPFSPSAPHNPPLLRASPPRLEALARQRTKKEKNTPDSPTESVDKKNTLQTPAKARRMRLTVVYPVPHDPEPASWHFDVAFEQPFANSQPPKLVSPAKRVGKVSFSLARKDVASGGGSCVLKQRSMCMKRPSEERRWEAWHDPSDGSETRGLLPSPVFADPSSRTANLQTLRHGGRTPSARWFFKFQKRLFGRDGEVKGRKIIQCTLTNKTTFSWPLPSRCESRILESMRTLHASRLRRTARSCNPTESKALTSTDALRSSSSRNSSRVRCVLPTLRRKSSAAMLLFPFFGMVPAVTEPESVVGAEEFGEPEVDQAVAEVDREEEGVLAAARAEVLDMYRRYVLWTHLGEVLPETHQQWLASSYLREATTRMVELEDVLNRSAHNISLLERALEELRAIFVDYVSDDTEAKFLSFPNEIAAFSLVSSISSPKKDKPLSNESTTSASLKAIVWTPPYLLPSLSQSESTSTVPHTLPRANSPSRRPVNSATLPRPLFPNETTPSSPARLRLPPLSPLPLPLARAILPGLVADIAALSTSLLTAATPSIAPAAEPPSPDIPSRRAMDIPRRASAAASSTSVDDLNRKLLALCLAREHVQEHITNRRCTIDEVAISNGLSARFAALFSAFGSGGVAWAGGEEAGTGGGVGPGVRDFGEV
ncbi:hypothetical protein BDK51DRAFT_30218, partial [Blyttiomyces helicus]